MDAALREIRLALLEADVNFKVVKAFIDRVRDRAMDAAADSSVVRGLAPSQEVSGPAIPMRTGMRGSALLRLRALRSELNEA